MGIDIHGTCYAYDAGPGVFLRRAGSTQKYAVGAYAVLYGPVHNQYPMGRMRIQLIVRAGQERHNRRTGLDIFEKRGYDAKSRLYRNDPPRSVYDVPDDVRRDNAGVNHRGICRTDEILGVCDFHPAVGDHRV